MGDDLKTLRGWSASPEGAAAMKSGEDARRPRRMTRRQWRESLAVLQKMGEIASTVLPNVRWTDTGIDTNPGDNDTNPAPEAP